MLLLFCNLYFAMFKGTWSNYTWYDFINSLGIKETLNGIGLFLTSIFGDNQCNTLGDSLVSTSINSGIVPLISLILALITSIGIVVMAVKGVKKAFGIFFMGIR